MKIYGYSKVDRQTLLEMSEITISAQSTDLELLAEFLRKMAIKMRERENGGYSHFHFSDWNKALLKNVDMIISFDEKAEKGPV